MPIVKAIKSLDDVLHRRFGRISILFEVMNGFGFDCQSPVLDALRKAGKVNIGVTTSSLGDEPLVQAHIKRVGYAEYFIARERIEYRPTAVSSVITITTMNSALPRCCARRPSLRLEARTLGDAADV